MLLRVAVGYHFYKEGTAKLKSGTFTSKYFLSAAKGPLAHYFKGMLEDPDGMEQLCIKEDKSGDSTSYSIDTEQTFAIWDDFIDRTFDYYGLGSEELAKAIHQQGKALKEEFDKARADGDEKLAQELREKIESLAANQESIGNQPEQAEDIFANHRQQLIEFLDYNEVELISHFGTADRLQGFQRDGQNAIKWLSTLIHFVAKSTQFALIGPRSSENGLLKLPVSGTPSRVRLMNLLSTNKKMSKNVQNC